VVSIRILLQVLGLGIAVVGILLARSGVDPFIGLAILIVGAFLLILPFTRRSEDE
jgi:hypothetical protein